MTRHARYTADKKKGAPAPLLDLPPIKAGAHLVDYLLEVGPACGGEAISYTEIGSWKAQTGVILNAWGTTALRSLSQAYVAEYYAAAAPLRAPPGRVANPDHVETFQSLSSALDRMEAQQDQREA